jgi:hypothetical protein
MGWKTDWLYRLVFERVRDVWTEGRAYSENYNEHTQAAVYPELRQPPLERLIVVQFADAELSVPCCTGAVLRVWRYDSAGLVPLPGEPPKPIVVEREQRIQGRRCNLFLQGVVSFYISPDRKHVVFTFALGPLYGRGYTYAVSGQGKMGRLSPAPDSVAWIS